MVTGILTLRKQSSGRYEMDVKNRELLLNKLVSEFIDEDGKNVALALQIKPFGKKKTSRQMGYYRAEILPRLTAGFRDLGNICNKDSVHYTMKMAFFRTHDKVNIITGEITKEPDSLATATKEEMSDFINDCVVFGQTELMITFVTPEEYYGEM